MSANVRGSGSRAFRRSASSRAKKKRFFACPASRALSSEDRQPSLDGLRFGGDAGSSYLANNRSSSDDLLRRALHAAVPIGNLATAIIVVNNLRDRRTDRRVGKRTLAVRLGGAFARWEFAALVLSSYAALFPLASAYGPEWILPLASFPLAVPQLRAVAMGRRTGPH